MNTLLAESMVNGGLHKGRNLSLFPRPVHTCSRACSRACQEGVILDSIREPFSPNP